MNWWVGTKKFASTVTRYVSISAFASLVRIHINIANSVVGLKILVQELKSIIKKKKKKHDKIVLLAKTKLNTIEVLICKGLIESYISRNKFKRIWWYVRRNQKFKDFNSI